MELAIWKPVNKAHAYAIKQDPIPINFVKPIVYWPWYVLITPSAAMILLFTDPSMFNSPYPCAGFIHANTGI